MKDNNGKSLKVLKEQMEQLITRRQELNEELYDSKITTSRVLLVAVGFVILSAVLITVAAIVWPAALLISAFSVAFFSQIAHAVDNKINSFITGVKLDRIEKQLTELGSQAKSQNKTLASGRENRDSTEKSNVSSASNDMHSYGPLFPALQTIVEEKPADSVNVTSFSKSII